LDEEVDYSIQAFLLYMFTRSVFSAKSDRIFLNFLPALEDLSRIRSYGWGISALGWMYSNIGEMANGEKAMFLGLHFLWEVRYLLFYLTSLLFFCFDLRFNKNFVPLHVLCYERLTPLAPRRKGQALFPMPCVERWKVSRIYAKAQKSISMFRRDLDRITAAQVKILSFNFLLFC